MKHPTLGRCLRDISLRSLEEQALLWNWMRSFSSESVVGRSSTRCSCRTWSMKPPWTIGNSSSFTTSMGRNTAPVRMTCGKGQRSWAVYSLNLSRTLWSADFISSLSHTSLAFTPNKHDTFWTLAGGETTAASSNLDNQVLSSGSEEADTKLDTNLESAWCISKKCLRAGIWTSSFGIHSGIG
ncbi:hypothetical protein EYF80_002667 [Liparis tanakae]|uniref:Uncharacterized protein n=1 Tax=Liparis tanakae TaxID=230148 RepID=A0A4Z2JC77_9TELE|nr:hypothetical protein EYF80_002667 [Liparis tanakae]